MSHRGSANPAQLSILRAALDEFCQMREITDDNDRNDVGQMLMSIYECGIETREGLLAGLDAILRDRLRREV